MLLKTGQITAYHVADDGDYEMGVAQRYVVLDAGQYAGTSNIEVASYAAATISFAAPNQVNDAANGLAHILTNDIVVIKGSVDNDGVYTVAGGGVAAGFTTVEATIVNGLAGPYVSLYKRTAHSNNVVIDVNTRLFWSRYTSSGERVGPVSTGTLVWYDATLVFTLHPAAADLAIVMPGNILRIVGGAAEITRYHVGDLLKCGGFANAVNNLPGYYVVSVTVNGADLDIVFDPCQNTLLAEAAGGARTIGLVTRSIFNYAAGANLGSLAGDTDWRIPNDFSLQSLREMEAPTGLPDAVAFPGWPAGEVWTSSTLPSGTTNGIVVGFVSGIAGSRSKTTGNVPFCALVRG